ncbi:MAG: hypothetical protein JWN29_702 [Acidimicrobiales bacterium]|nr:hypothetical protein [Acidimicrobiales bacterium]
MGLRSRRPRRAPRVTVPDEGWVGPHRGGVTVVGNLDSALEATVDDRGLVTAADDWSLDWWVGADDRWHLPPTEVAVRQRLVGDAPVVETAMRVPSGDVVQRVYAVRLGADELVVVEFENESPIPVALALALRPYDATGEGRIERISLDGDTAALVDGQVALLFPKPPSRAAGSGTGDVADVVLAGAAEVDLGAVGSDDGRATAAYVWPLAHRATLRFAVPLAPTELRRLPALPGPEQVANGWRMQSERGLRLVLPDDRLAAAVDANRRTLLLRYDGPGARPVLGQVAGALDRYGYAEEAAELLATDPEAAGLAALTGHWLRHRDELLAKSVAADVAELAEAAVRSGSGSPFDVLAAADALAAAGEARAAGVARRAAADLPDVQVDSRAESAELTTLLDTASPTRTWPGADLGPAARLLTLARDLLARETGEGLVLLSIVPDAWLGLGVEIHDAPTAFGRLSFAVRWHGDRPALLWELDLHPGVDAVRITAPGLDPGWSTTDRRGDALLAPVLPPGTPVSLKRR